MKIEKIQINFGSYQTYVSYISSEEKRLILPSHIFYFISRPFSTMNRNENERENKQSVVPGYL